MPIVKQMPCTAATTGLGTGGRQAERIDAAVGDWHLPPDENTAPHRARSSPPVK